MSPFRHINPAENPEGFQHRAEIAVVVIGSAVLVLLAAVAFFATRSELTRSEVRDLVEAAQTGKLCAAGDQRACDQLVARNHDIEEQTDHRLCITTECTRDEARDALVEYAHKHHADLRGPRGRRGPQGRRGATGKTGPRGEVGPRGNDGTDGSRGPRGPRGSKGSKGRRGHLGLTGKDGVVPDVPDDVPDLCMKNGGCWKPRF